VDLACRMSLRGMYATTVPGLYKNGTCWKFVLGKPNTCTGTCILQPAFMWIFVVLDLKNINVVAPIRLVSNILEYAVISVGINTMM